MSHDQDLRILGIRGIPARHGGFETFVEHLAPDLVARGWKVTVYCQEPGTGPIRSDVWNGINRVLIPSGDFSPLSTIRFDLACVRDAARYGSTCLTLGYNTAVFGAILRMKGVANLINMDGVEWKRSKWSWPAKAWFYLNDWMGCWLGDHLIADHPQIEALLQTRANASKITCIPYGACEVVQADEAQLAQLGLLPKQYLTVVSRIEPENSILEIVRSFSSRERGVKLAVVGSLNDQDRYHRSIKSSASDEVTFLGGIYDRQILASIRAHCIGYLHGHQVGGTNPSLLEAMAAGNPVIAHDNRYNNWVAGDGALYFAQESGIDSAIDQLLTNPGLRTSMSEQSLQRIRSDFSWETVLCRYHSLLLQWAHTEKVFARLDNREDVTPAKVRVREDR